MLAACNAGFDGEPFTHADIVGAFAGIRPIVDTGLRDGDPSAATREEAIWHENGIVSVAGGKLTTWRATAEEALDVALKHLPREIARRTSKCATAGTPLAGLAPLDLSDRLTAMHDVEPGVAQAMAHRLGSMAWHAIDQAEPADLRPLREDIDLCTAELRAHLRWGAVVRLSDLLLRRVRLGMWRPDQAADLADSVSQVAAAELTWDATRRDAELERFGSELAAWTPRGARDS